MTSRAVARAVYAPLLGIAAYAGVLAARLPSLVHDTATSDSSGPMVIAQALPDRRPGSDVVLGNAAHYTTIWFDELTRSLPGHRAIWTAMPYVLSLLGILLLAETVRRLAGVHAALITLGIAIATPPLVLLPLFAQGFHGVTVVNGIVLASLLVWLASTPRPGAAHVLAAAAVIAVATGLDVASDLLLAVTGLAPFAAAAALLAWRRRDSRSRGILAVAAGVVVTAAIAAALTAVAMHHAGFTVLGVSRRPATPTEVKDNAWLLGQLVVAMANGEFAPGSLGVLGPLRLLLGVLAIAGTITPLWLLARVARGSGVDGDATPQPYHRDAVALFLAFWGFTALFLAAFFLASRAPVDRSSMRYLVSGFMAVAATVPFLAPRRAIAVAVAVNGVLGAVLLQRATLADFGELAPTPAAALVADLRAHGVHHGYAGYWQANALTWESDGAITVRSVQQSPVCHPTAPGWFCPYQFFSIADWYAPQPGPSFLIRELGGAYVAAPPPAGLQPTSVFSYGGRFEVFVFDHDIGADAAAHTTGWPASPPG